jgi:endonuclease YncB( thermonuclease family)
LAKRNDIVPYERPQARKWTRISDYVADAEARVVGMHWPQPSALRAIEVRNAARRRSARGFLLPIAALIVAAILSLWASGVFAPPASRSVASQTSRGLKFGLCTQGGLTNCVASGDSFYLKGKTVRLAGIEAPRLYGSACAREAELGRRAATHLQAILNSGEIRLTKVEQDLDSYGLLLRNVAVNGKDVARAMTEAGFARGVEANGSWC